MARFAGPFACIVFGDVALSYLKNLFSGKFCDNAVIHRDLKTF